MNLRVIKKDIEYFIGEFICECAIYAALTPEKKAEKAAKRIGEASKLHNRRKHKVNHPEGATRAYYAGIRAEMDTKIDELFERLSAIAGK